MVNKGMRWLGIKTSHILELAISQTPSPATDMAIPPSSQSSATTDAVRASIASTECREPISHLTTRDRKVANGTLGRLAEPPHTDFEAMQLGRELRVMLMLGVKTEIQWLDDSGCISTWLNREIEQAFALPLDQPCPTS